MGAAETRGSRFDRLVPGNGQLIALLSRPARAHAFVCRHDRLLLRARGRDAEAIDEFRSAIYAPTFGYTRTNLELAKLYLRNRRARDAVAVLQPALRGPLDGSNLYVTARSCRTCSPGPGMRLVGVTARVCTTRLWPKPWSAGDRSFRARAEQARARAAALTAQ